MNFKPTKEIPNIPVETQKEALDQELSPAELK